MVCSSFDEDRSDTTVQARRQSRPPHGERARLPPSKTPQGGWRITRTAVFRVSRQGEEGDTRHVSGTHQLVLVEPPVAAAVSRKKRARFGLEVRGVVVVEGDGE